MKVGLNTHFAMNVLQVLNDWIDLEQCTDYLFPVLGIKQMVLQMELAPFWLPFHCHVLCKPGIILLFWHFQALLCFMVQCCCCYNVVDDECHFILNLWGRWLVRSRTYQSTIIPQSDLILKNISWIRATQCNAKKQAISQHWGRPLFNKEWESMTACKLTWLLLANHVLFSSD